MSARILRDCGFNSQIGEAQWDQMVEEAGGKGFNSQILIGEAQWDQMVEEAGGI
jgi:hypothetical protein